MLRTVGTPLGRVWTWSYRAIARATGAYLTRGEAGASVYVRGGLGTGNFVPGLSDIDLVVVLGRDPEAPGAAGRRVLARWQRLRRVPPTTGLLLDTPRIYEEPELRDIAGSSALTYGLGSGRAAPVHRIGESDLAYDALHLRPGLYGPTADWQPLSGPDRRPGGTAREAADRHVAGWLELSAWWRELFPLFLQGTGPRTAALCVKLVSEPARIWLWLAHGERLPDRASVLARARELLPSEEPALRQAAELERSLTDSPDPPLAGPVGALVRLSSRIAETLEAQAAERGATEVELAGGEPDELILPEGSGGAGDPREAPPGLMPLTDWRAVVFPEPPDESFTLLPGDPGHPNVLSDALAARPTGPYAVLQAAGLMVLPGHTARRTRLRAVQCSATDPVSFALAGGRKVAAFPDLPGWSARDTAARAVAEHNAWLHATPGSPRAAVLSATGARGLAMLLTATRAALFFDSVMDGEPRLPLTMAEAVRRVANHPGASGVAEEALTQYREFALHGEQPSAAVVAAMRNVVLGLPAYSDSRLRRASP